MILELSRRQQTSPGGVKASSRDLANACKNERRAIVRALDKPTSRGLITTRQGTATGVAS